MTRPGVVVTSRADPPPRSAPTDSGVAFMVGATETGDDLALCAAFSQYQTMFGDRAGFTDAYDAAEAFFREGGGKLYVSRTNGSVAGATEAPEPPEAPTKKTASKSEAAAEPEAEPRVVDAGIAAALDRFTRSLGPGQVFSAGGALDYAADTHTALLAHAAASNRIALLSAISDADAATLEAAATALAADVNGRYGALFAPAAIVPGVTSADTRTVPYSAIEAGIIARNDRSYSPNVAAAGINGQSAFAIDLSMRFTDDEREQLNDACVDIARMVYDGVRTYGYRTLASLDSGWGLLSNARLNMEIVAKAEEVAERYVFAQIDGRRVKISQFGAELTGMLVPYYEAGSLFGTSVDDAFYVDVGPAVNTLETIAAGELHAVIGLRMSPFAELVVVEIVKVAVDTPLSVAA